MEHLVQDVPLIPAYEIQDRLLLKENERAIAPRSYECVKLKMDRNESILFRSISSRRFVFGLSGLWITLCVEMNERNMIDTQSLHQSTIESSVFSNTITDA